MIPRKLVNSPHILHYSFPGYQLKSQPLYSSFGKRSAFRKDYSDDMGKQTPYGTSQIPRSARPSHAFLTSGQRVTLAPPCASPLVKGLTDIKSQI